MFVVPASAGVSSRLQPEIAKASSIHGLKAGLQTISKLFLAMFKPHSLTPLHINIKVGDLNFPC